MVLVWGGDGLESKDVGMTGSNADGLTIEQILVGRFAVFAYLIIDPESKEALLLDPGSEPAKILDHIESAKADLRWIVCSHTHPDHIGGVKHVKESTRARVGVHEDEAACLSMLSRRILVRIMGGRAAPKADFVLHDGDTLALGGHLIRILHTPGHSKGGICLLFDKNLFTGDTLFIGGVGRTDLPGASWKVLASSLANKVLVLSDDTRIWPGHHYGAYPSNLLGLERRENPFLKEIGQWGKVRK